MTHMNVSTVINRNVGISINTNVRTNIDMNTEYLSSILILKLVSMAKMRIFMLVSILSPLDASMYFSCRRGAERLVLLATVPNVSANAQACSEACRDSRKRKRDIE